MPWTRPTDATIDSNTTAAQAAAAAAQGAAAASVSAAADALQTITTVQGLVQAAAASATAAQEAVTAVGDKAAELNAIKADTAALRDQASGFSDAAGTAKSQAETAASNANTSAGQALTAKGSAESAAQSTAQLYNDTLALKNSAVDSFTAASAAAVAASTASANASATSAAQSALAVVSGGPYLHAKDQRANGAAVQTVAATGAGAATSVVREFQTIQENTIGGVTLVANTFKDLPAGNYYISAESYVPGSLGHSSQLKVYDSTHAADLLLGAPGYVLSGPTSGPNFKIDVKGRFTLAAKSDIQIIAGVRDTTVSIGLGNLATAVFGDNVHGEVEIWRLPTPA